MQTMSERLYATNQSSVQAVAFEMTQEFMGTQCLGIIIHHQQMGGFLMGAGADHTPDTGQFAFDVMNLIGREGFIDMYYGIGVEADHFLFSRR